MPMIQFQMLCSAVRYARMVQNVLWLSRRKRLPWGTSEVYRLREEVERRTPSERQPEIRTRFRVKDFQEQFFGLSEFDNERSGSCCHSSGSGLFTYWPGSRLTALTSVFSHFYSVLCCRHPYSPLKYATITS